MSSIITDYAGKLSEGLTSLCITASQQATRNAGTVNDSEAVCRFSGFASTTAPQPPPVHDIWAPSGRMEFTSNPRKMRDVQQSQMLSYENQNLNHNPKPTSSYGPGLNVENWCRPAVPKNEPPRDFAGASRKPGQTNGASNPGNQKNQASDLADNSEFLSLMTEFHTLYTYIFELKAQRVELQKLIANGNYELPENVKNMTGFNVCLHIKFTLKLIRYEYSVVELILSYEELFDDYELYKNAQLLLVAFADQIAKLQQFQNYNIEQVNGVMRKKPHKFDELKNLLVSIAMYVRYCSTFFYIMAYQIKGEPKDIPADRRNASFIG